MLIKSALLAIATFSTVTVQQSMLVTHAETGEQSSFVEIALSEQHTFLQNPANQCHFKVVADMGTEDEKVVVEAPDGLKRNEPQFIQVGLGNIDKVPIVEDGDIQQYPVRAYGSKGLKCAEARQVGVGQILVQSTLLASMRKGDPSQNFQELSFETQINFDKAQGSVEFQTRQTNVTEGSESEFDFVSVTLKSHQTEKIYGLGLQYTHIDFKGKFVHILSSEGGVGRGLEPLTSIMNTQSKHQGGSTVTTYAPAYTFATSERRGVIFPDHTEIGSLDFKSSLYHFTGTLWKLKKGEPVKMKIFHGKTLKSVVSALTSVTGRMKALPAWTQKGAIVGLQGGQDKVQQDYKFLKEQGVPMKSVWMQDWVGTFKFPEGVRLLWNWSLNRFHYPHWDDMLDSWEKDGVRPMVYMNPYFANLTGNDQIVENLFKDADSKGFFLKNDKDASYLIQSLSIEFAMVDFTSANATEWAKSVIKNNMLGDARSVGWMCDFGEYTPMDVHMADASMNAYTYHNKYPYDWAKATKEAVAEANKTDETVYFMRAGSTMSPGQTSLFWMGDQLPTFDRFDGLHSALIGLLNGGMSGFALGHSDIGGYTSLNDTENLNYYRRDEQMLIRWMEMSAFSDAVFRTHPSNNPAFNAQIWDNEGIAKHFKKFAEVFIDLGEYRMKLMKETEATGIPITRSLMLEFDNTEWNIDDQFMLGSEVMMAPILTRDATKRKVFFPYLGRGGYWQHYFTGRKIAVKERTGIYMWISCPMGTPAAFKRVSGKEDATEYNI